MLLVVTDKETEPLASNAYTRKKKNEDTGRGGKSVGRLFFFFVVDLGKRSQTFAS
jgi:hypothetical protein